MTTPAAKLPSNILTEAFKTSHDACQGPDKCLHANALIDNDEEVQRSAHSGAMAGLLTLGNPAEGAWNDGFHVGFRAAQLMAEATESETAAATAKEAK